MTRENVSCVDCLKEHARKGEKAPKECDKRAEGAPVTPARANQVFSSSALYFSSDLKRIVEYASVKEGSKSMIP